MLQLVAPTPAVHRSFLAALDEFRLEGRLGPDDRSALPREARDVPQLRDLDGFDRYVSTLRQWALEDAPRPDGWVPTTVLWYVDGDEWIGRLAIRHRLNPMLLEIGGHIGYDVRPSMRRRGHATAMLRNALPIAARLGIDPVLVTCRVDNIGSRKVIEANGGRFEDERAETLRFWIPTTEPGARG